MPKKESTRCWPGYTPVPGKDQHEQGSCRPKADSQMTGGEKNFRAKRKRQIDAWQKDHPDSPRKSAQHVSAPGTRKQAATKKKMGTKKTAKPKSPAKNSKRSS